MLAKDIMRKDVVTVAPFMSLQELAKILDDNRLTGVAVIDEEGKVLGVVSQTDLVRAGREAGTGIPAFHGTTDEGAAAAGFHYEDPDRARVEQIMTPGGISFDEDTPIEALAREMMDRHIHRVLITRKGKLCGLVSTMDMLRALLPQPVVAGAPKPRHKR